MLRSILFIFLAAITGLIQAQPAGDGGSSIRTLGPRPPKGITRAVVIGISDYPSPGIRPLQYAHRDALAFAEFLQSRAGGQVPDSLMRVLINDNATLAAVYDALYWLRTSSGPGDQAILYFAGHGDIEKEAHWQFGYLLCHDSPSHNFRSNAVRVEDLDLLAIELSSVKEVRTVFIIDACRSGTLSEGRQVPHEHLSKQQANEVRILSCKSDQISLEGPQWGGGRGLFTWSLIQGLQGLAKDEGLGDDPDQVTLEELSEFLRRQQRKESQSLVPPTRQDPVVVGPETFPLARVDQDILAQVRAESLLPPDQQGLIASRSLEQEPHDMALTGGSASMTGGRQWLEAARRANVLEGLDLTPLTALPPEDIPAALLALIGQQEAETSAREMFRRYFLPAATKMLEDSVQSERLRHTLAILLHDRSQEYINRYLNADVQDLADRSYYRLRQSGYQQHPALFRLALSLLPPDHPLVPRLHVKGAYFTGVSLRIAALFEPDMSAALDSALAFQLEALALDDKAPYIHNELGILYKFMERDSLAEFHLRRAMDLAPSWGLPVSNLCGLMIRQENREAAWQLAGQALKLVPEYFGIHIHLGRLYEHGENLFMAEHHFRTAERLDANHFMPNMLLGHLYLRTTEYEKAESEFDMARSKKDGLNMSMSFTSLPVIDHIVMADMPFDQRDDVPEQVLLQRIRQNPDDAEAHFILGLKYIRWHQLDKAESSLREVIRIDPGYPALWEQLAWLYYRMDRLAEADLAMRRFFERSMHTDIHLMLHAGILEAWGRTDEAISLYARLTEQWAWHHQPYRHLGRLYAESGRPDEAEKVWLRFAKLAPKEAENQLYHLYASQSDQGKGDDTWKTRLLRLLAAQCLQDAGKEVGRDDAGFEMAPAKSSELEEYYRYCLQGRASRLPDQWKEKPAVCERSLMLLDSLLQSSGQEEEQADLLSLRSRLARQTGDLRGAIRDMEKALAASPDRISLQDQLLRTYLEHSRLEEARTLLEGQYHRDRLRYPDHLELARAYIHSMDFTQARGLLTLTEKACLEASPPWRLRELRARILWLSGDLAGARQAYLNLLPEAPTPETEYSLARIASLSGGKDEAMQRLQSLVDKGWHQRSVFAFDPVWDPVRKSPAFLNLMEKNHLLLPDEK